MPLRSMVRKIMPRKKPAAPESGQNVLDWYVQSPPAPQNALDIFRGDWSSKLPPPLADCQAGNADLFEDARITWFAEQVGGFEGKTALELGPLEGGHSYMLEKLGAESVVAIEGNTRAFLKCLIVKELLGLRRVRFLCGDFLAYLRSDDDLRFDLCLASGVLYHMQDPVELIAGLARKCNRHLLLWTHYYDEAIIGKSPVLSPKFTGSKTAEHDGFRHTLHRQEYQAALTWGGFCGGTAPTSNWMSREEILSCLRHFGFNDLRIAFDHRDHPNGPAFAVSATRSA